MLNRLPPKLLQKCCDSELVTMQKDQPTVLQKTAQLVASETDRRLHMNARGFGVVQVRVRCVVGVVCIEIEVKVGRFACCMSCRTVEGSLPYSSKSRNASVL